MVPLSDRDLVVRRALEDSELQPVQAFVFETRLNPPASAHTPDLMLLAAISRDDASAFREQVAELERRRINSESTWCDNDCLVFCLLLGCEKFEIDTPLIKAVLDARERNRNPIPRRVNEVFRALSRKEHAMVEEFAFIKVVYDHLRGQLRLSPETSIKLYDTLTQPKFCDELPPFISLLAIRAYDLIITERKPSVFENFPQLIDGVEKLGDSLSVRQIFQLFMAVPVKSLWFIGLAVVAIFGFGMTAQHVIGTFSLPTKTPERLKIASVHDGQHLNDRVLESLAAAMIASHPPHPGMASRIVFVRTEAFGAATGKFSAELSNRDAPVLDGYAFSAKDSDIGPQRVILPIRASEGTVKVLVPPSDSGAWNEFLLLVEIPEAVDPSLINGNLILRLME